mmetsp:Transcript_1139/g.3635  ORF Transcript_1139/g.3635 Transcript_1139/m.3635 type:complete len:233 (-) Transcript_1139:216-914(-)
MRTVDDARRLLHPSLRAQYDRALPFPLGKERREPTTRRRAPRLHTVATLLLQTTGGTERAGPTISNGSDPPQAAGEGVAKIERPTPCFAESSVDGSTGRGRFVPAAGVEARPSGGERAALGMSVGGFERSDAGGSLLAGVHGSTAAGASGSARRLGSGESPMRGVPCFAGLRSSSVPMSPAISDASVDVARPSTSGGCSGAPSPSSTSCADPREDMWRVPLKQSVRLLKRSR